MPPGFRNSLTALERPLASLRGCDPNPPPCKPVWTARVVRSEKKAFEPQMQQIAVKRGKTPAFPNKPWVRIEQALRTEDLLLQGGGFSAIVFDMGNIAPEHASRIPLATWFRYRAAAETQASILLLTQRSHKEEAAVRRFLLECAGTFSPRVEERDEKSAFLCVIDIAGTENPFLAGGACIDPKEKKSVVRMALPERPFCTPQRTQRSQDRSTPTAAADSGSRVSDTSIQAHTFFK